MTLCPCGTGRTFAQCCEPALDGAPCASAEALMRSRYCAYTRGDENHLFRTWHPRTRPQPPYCDPHIRWVGLEILSVEAGGEADDEGIVEFIASWELRHNEGGVRAAGGGSAGGAADQSGQLHERSRFTRRAGRWVYVDGEE